MQVLSIIDHNAHVQSWQINLIRKKRGMINEEREALNSAITQVELRRRKTDFIYREVHRPTLSGRCFHCGLHLENLKPLPKCLAAVSPDFISQPKRPAFQTRLLSDI